MYLGAIADDVTGGTDLASVLRRHGARVVQTFGMPRARVPDADAIVVSLKIRTAPAETACGQAAAAAAFLRQAGARQIYFKYCSTFDSTDAGNIGPVIDTLLDQSPAPFTVACPAYPQLGRTTYCGHLFVGDRLLSESSMRHHPLTPMTDANLVRVLSRQSRSSIGLVALVDVEAGAGVIRARLETLAAGNHRVAVVDAIFDRHIHDIATACADLPLVTGGAALGGALGALQTATRAPGTETRMTVSAPVAVLSGSCSSASRQQVERLAAHVPARAVNPMKLAGNGRECEVLVSWACDQAERGSLLVYSSDAPDAVQDAQRQLGRDTVSALVESAFQRLAVALVEKGVRSFVVAGGETSGAVIQALGIQMLGFGDEIEPGVPWTYSVQPAGFALALKSGNFGSPEFFLKALEQAA
jgi:uncharacterized protein YgbK (DUF1537 family)